MVEMNDGLEAADTPVGEIIEEVGDPEESIESVAEEDANTPSAEPEQAQGTSEPGWFKTRWNKEVSKLSEQIRGEVRAEYDQKMAPLMERLVEMDARDLVASGKVKDLETAKELVRYRNNQPQMQTQAEQPRNANGQYAPKNNPVQEAQINLLTQQAQKIKAKTGVDVIAVMDSDPEIKSKIVSGEMDFYDVLEQQQSKPAVKKKAPSPMRSPNGAAAHSPNAIENMTDEQFKRMEDKISKGARYALK